MSELGKNPDDARVELDRARDLAATTRRTGSRWMRVYLLVWAVASAGLVLAIGLLGRTGAIVGLSVWGVAVVAGVVWSRRQGAVVEGGPQRVGTSAAGWAVVYGVVLAVGLGGEVTDAWFWVVGAAATAVPLVVAAIRCDRCAERETGR